MSDKFFMKARLGYENICNRYSLFNIKETLNKKIYLTIDFVLLSFKSYHLNVLSGWCTVDGLVPRVLLIDCNQYSISKRKSQGFFC